MSSFEELIRDVEDTTGMAFPYQSATIAVGMDFSAGFATDHARLSTSPYVNKNHEVLLLKHSYAFAHEVIHYYFHGGASWVTEGATTFVEALVLNKSSIETGDWPFSCPKDRIVDIAGVRQYQPAHSICAYLLGADLFLDLYNSLGAAAFFDTFRRLQLGLTQDEVEEETFSGIRCSSCGEVEPGLYYVRRAFVTEAPPEVAAIAEPIIMHRYYVGDR